VQLDVSSRVPEGHNYRCQDDHDHDEANDHQHHDNHDNHDDGAGHRASNDRAPNNPSPPPPQLRSPMLRPYPRLILPIVSMDLTARTAGTLTTAKAS